MTEIGYALSSEEFGPRELVRNARRAEEAGFTFALISDHYHPWISRQGHSPFVWNVIGGIAEATSRLRLGTGVTCPTFRIHPAIIAQAAATSAAPPATSLRRPRAPSPTILPLRLRAVTGSTKTPSTSSSTSKRAAPKTLCKSSKTTTRSVSSRAAASTVHFLLFLFNCFVTGFDL